MKRSKLLQSSKDILHRSFKPEKCKTSLRLVISRLKLLRNKKEVQVKQMRREIAQLLESGQDQTARIRVEHVIREEKLMAAYELISLYSELITSRMPIIESQKNCPIDLKEAITSVIFASPRCGDVTELVDIQKHFTAKYGKDFITAAIELRPDCGVSPVLVEKLSARAPDGQTKLKMLTAIAEEHSVNWDPKAFEGNETIPNVFLSGPTTFEDTKVHTESPLYKASNLDIPQSQMHKQSLKSEQNARFPQGTQNLNYTDKDGGGTTISSTSQHEVRHSGLPTKSPVVKQSFSEAGNPSTLGRQSRNMEFKDAASAAQAAAESAERASMAARAAAEFASYDKITKQYFTESHQYLTRSQQPSVHVERDNTTEKHLTSKLEGEQLPKDSTNNFNSDRHPSSHSEQVEDVIYHNMGGAAGRFDQDGYGSTQRDSQSTSLRSNASADDDSFTHATQDAANYCQKNILKVEDDKPEIITKKQSGNSEYVNNLQEAFRPEIFDYIQEETIEPENFDYIQEETIVKQSVTSTCRHSSLSGDNNNFSDFNTQQFQSHAVAAHLVGSVQERIHRDASDDVDNPFFDKSGSDDEKISFDTGPKFDEQDSDLDFLSSGRAPPFDVFTNPDAQDSGFNFSTSPEKSVSSLQNSKEKHLSSEFPEILAAPVDINMDEAVSMKFDDSDGLNSESACSMDESGDSRRNYSAKLPIRGNEIPPASASSSIMEHGNSGSDKDNDHFHTFSGGLEDDESVSQTSSEFSSNLNFGKLTGGLRNKGYTLPPYTRSQLDDVSPSVKRPAEESSSIILEPPTSSAAESPSNVGVSINVDNKTSSRGPSSLSDSDTSSSEDELPVQSYRRETCTREAGKETETKARLKGSLTYFESESEEDLPKQPFDGRKHSGGGFSRRTKATPSSSKTSKPWIMSEELRNSDLSAETDSGSSFNRTQFPEESLSQKWSSGEARKFEQSTSANGSFERMPDSKMSNRRESLKSAAEEQPASPPEQKVDAIGGTKSSQTSLSKGDTLSREDSVKKATHVHPKLPDYDNVAARLDSLRKNH